MRWENREGEERLPSPPANVIDYLFIILLSFTKSEDTPLHDVMPKLQAQFKIPNVNHFTAEQLFGKMINQPEHRRLRGGQKQTGKKIVVKRHHNLFSLFLSF